MKNGMKRTFAAMSAPVKEKSGKPALYWADDGSVCDLALVPGQAARIARMMQQPEVESGKKVIQVWNDGPNGEDWGYNFGLITAKALKAKQRKFQL